MHHPPDGSVNLGATYIKEDYYHVSKYIDRGMPFRLNDTYAENGKKLTTLLHWSNLRNLFPLRRLLARLRELRAVNRAFRKESEQIPPRDLLAKYPLIAKYTRQSAVDLITELGLWPLHRRYFGSAFMATVFMDPLRSNAFFYLFTLLPIIEPTWVADFTLTYERLTSGYNHRIRLDSVVGMNRNQDRSWQLTMASGFRIKARNVVIAAPYHNAVKFYPVPRPRDLTSGTVLAVRGDRRPPYRGRGLISFHSEENGVCLVWRQLSGLDLVNCIRTDPNLSAIYSTWEIVDRADWRTAVSISGSEWVPVELESGLYLAGDYNIGGLEDSFISGLCAANHIVKKKQETPSA